MNHIKVMDESLANLIAAGEVVERPLSVIKELVENSIDAQASKIIIELKDSGISQIIVSDNGIGVNKEDIPLMCKRHATSKISNNIDLVNITTLGFRGEALASISAVSKVKITSSVDGLNTYQYSNIEDSIIKVAGNQGTSVEVNNLFYNTPVRFKHLSHPNYELSLITNLVKQVSLIYPNISFSIINNDKPVYSTVGNNNPLDVLTSMYGSNVSKEFSHITTNSGDFTIDAYIAHPIITRASKKDIIISVNHRLIKNIKLEQAIIDGYKGYLHTNQYPIVYLNIDLDPSLVDVNIHPTKQQIKISFLNDLNNTISNMFHNELTTLNFIPEYSLNQEEVITNNQEVVSEVKFDKAQTTFDFKQVKSNETNNWQLPVFSFIGNLYQTYLLFQNEEGLYLLDQHAAQERINYEKFMELFANKDFIYQQLMIPITINLSNEEGTLFYPHYQEMEQVGIKLDALSECVYQIKAIDQFYQRCQNLDNDLLQMIRLVTNNHQLNLAELYEDVAIMMACKSSIKAHQYLDRLDVDSLLTQLNECVNPFTCPHGRPIINKISKYEIEKLFKRNN